MTFSVSTIAASTSTPMAIAMPLSDMIFDVIPNCFIRMNEMRIETGSGNVTMRIEVYPEGLSPKSPPGLSRMALR